MPPCTLLARERQRRPSIYAQCYDEQRLHGVYYQHEVEGVVVSHAVQYKHGLHGEVPRTGAVGRGHYDGYAADNERDQGALEAEAGGEVEAEERQVIVQEVAYPDAEGVEDEQRCVPDAFQRYHALPYSAQRGFHLIVYR